MTEEQQSSPEALDPKVLELKQAVIDVLKSCYDPEIPVNIYELGLIYDIEVEEAGFVHIRMTLTSPACPVAGTLPPEIEAKVNAIPNIAGATVEVVWEPTWTMDMMSDEAKLQLGFY